MHARLLPRELTSVIFLLNCNTLSRTSLAAGEALEWGTLVGTNACDAQETTVAGLTQKSTTTASCRMLDRESDCF